MALEMSPQVLKEETALLGKTLVAQLFILFKTSQNYSEGHAALNLPVANVLKVVLEILRRNEEASLRVKGRSFMVGEIRLKLDFVGFDASRYVMEEMKRHLVGGICFSRGVTGDDLRRLVYAFREVGSVPAPDNYMRIQERMQQRMISNIEVEALPEEVETVGSGRERLQDGNLKARLLFRKALSAMDEVMRHAAAGQPLRLRESKRVVQHIIDLLATNESSLLGLTALSGQDGCAQNHAVNVCILSLVLGRRFAMSKLHLCELGMTGLLHDIGKAGISRQILDKPGPLSPQEQQTLEAHTVYGVKKIMRLKSLDALSCRIITGIFEHHLLADYSGYPRFPYQRLGLSGTIISIADGYDGLTSSRVGGRKLFPTDQALRFMLTRAGKAYDPGLLKLFINCVGVHGIGSLLLLDSKELAVVVRNHPDPAMWDHPRIKIIADAGGREVDGEVVDLSRPEPSRMIIANLDRHNFNLDVARYFN